MYQGRNTGRGRRWIRPTGVVGVAVAAGLLLAACSGPGGSSGAGGSATPTPGQKFNGQTLTVFDGAPSGSQAQQTSEYYNYLSALFHKETGATLNWEYYTSGGEETTKIETSVVSGTGPDVFSYGSSFIGVIGATHNFLTLTSADWNYLGGRSSFVARQLEDSGYTPSSQARTWGSHTSRFPSSSLTTRASSRKPASARHPLRGPSTLPTPKRSWPRTLEYTGPVSTPPTNSIRGSSSGRTPANSAGGSSRRTGSPH